MTAGLLRAAGEYLYGPQWHTALARALGMNDRTIRRYADGERHVRPEVWAAIGELVAERRSKLTRILAVIGKRQRRALPRK